MAPLQMIIIYDLSSSYSQTILYQIKWRITALFHSGKYFSQKFRSQCKNQLVGRQLCVVLAMENDVQCGLLEKSGQF